MSSLKPLLSGVLLLFLAACGDKLRDLVEDEHAAIEALNPPKLVKAETLDLNGNGKIDHYRLTFDRAMDDSTFTGFISNKVEGSTAANWRVAGYQNVRIDMTVSGDQDDDTVIYLKFDETAAVCTADDTTPCDTGKLPELTTGEAPGLKSLKGIELRQLTASSVKETDAAPPIIANSKGIAVNQMTVVFSEPVVAAAGGPLTLGHFVYTNASGGGATALASMIDGNASDNVITMQVDANFNGDHNVDTLSAVSGAVVDAAGNSAPTTAFKLQVSFIKKIVTGQNHTCVLNGLGQVKCWGSVGPSGLGDYNDPGVTGPWGDEAGEMGSALPVLNLGTVNGNGTGGSLTVKDIAAGGDFNCAILQNDKVKCWGGAVGGLGYGDATIRGDNASEMGDNLPYVNLGSDGNTVVGLAAAYQSVCALFAHGRIKCWGSGVSGQLGSGNTNHLGDNAGEMGDSLPYVDLGSVNGDGSGGPLQIKKINGGNTNYCALFTNNKIKCWGDNTNNGHGYASAAIGDNAGEMGDNLAYVPVAISEEIVQIERTSLTGCALTITGKLYCWGGTAYLSFGSPALINVGAGRTVKAISGGQVRMCIILDNNLTRCFGAGDSWAGLGTETPTNLFPSGLATATSYVNFGIGRYATAVTADFFHTCALLDNGKIKCWGRADVGQTGHGNTGAGTYDCDSGAPVRYCAGDEAGEMGDNLPYTELGDGF